MKFIMKYYLLNHSILSILQSKHIDTLSQKDGSKLVINEGSCLSIVVVDTDRTYHNYGLIFVAW